MPYVDLRQYMKQLEEKGELMRISTQVDWHLELGAIIRRANDLRQPALLFENIKDYGPEYRILGNLVGATRPNAYGRLCLALELHAETPALEIIDELIRRSSSPVKPVLVDHGPCKENIMKGGDIDLLKFPAPFFRSFDGGRFIGTWHTDINRDPDSGWVNWGMYRHMIHDKQSIGWLAHPGQHGPSIFYQKYEAKGKPMPMAIAIGTSPACALASMMQTDPYVNEAELAGALNGKPVELIKCETIDLEVPATAEIVLEGEVKPYERKKEGPFGEYTGYRGSEEAPRPVFHVQCITHRDNPILTATSPGKPFDDTTFVYSLLISAALTSKLRKLGLPFKSLFVTSSTMGVVISTSETYPGYVHTLSSAIWATKAGVYRPTIIVVGEDVDVINMEEVMWALTTRMHPGRDIHIRKRAPSHPLFPFLSPEEKAAYTAAAAVCFDATFPFEWKEKTPQVVDFEHSWSEETQRLVISKWKEYGFE
jgi:phenylphosphate carboxylase alpha subunit